MATNQNNSVLLSLLSSNVFIIFIQHSQHVLSIQSSRMNVGQFLTKHCSQTERAHASNKAMFTVRLYIFVFHKHPTVFLKKNIQNCWSYNTYIICAMAVLALFITMHFIALCKRGRLVVPTRVVE